MTNTRAVRFDAACTLIAPGPTFRGEGDRAFGARRGIDIDASTCSPSVAGAASLLDGPGDAPHAAETTVVYTRRTG